MLLSPFPSLLLTLVGIQSLRKKDVSIAILLLKQEIGPSKLQSHAHARCKCQDHNVDQHDRDKTFAGSNGDTSNRVVKELAT
jgi:hypothetical protein